MTDDRSRTWRQADFSAGPAEPYELSYELDTLGPRDFGAKLPGGYAAHTKYDSRIPLGFHGSWIPDQ